MFITKIGAVSEHVDMLVGSEIPIYLVKGTDRWAVVDTGLSFTAPEMVRQVEDAGGRQKELYVLITHSHFDHVGGLAPFLRCFPDALTVAGSGTAEVFRKPAAMGFIRGTNENFVKILNLEKKYPGFDFSIPETIKVDITVREGDVVELGGGVRIRAYEVPGHSKCSMAFLLEPDRALFSGEAAGFYNGPGDIISEGLSDYSLYLAGLARMRDLRPKYICMPHNGVLTGGDAETYFDIALRSGEEFRRELAAMIADQTPEEKIIREITAKKYHGLIETQPVDVFTINLRAMIKAVRREMKPAG